MARPKIADFAIPMPPAKTDERPFNERLRAYRDSLGLTRADLAATLGVTHVTLYRWETGSTRPSPLAAKKLSELGFGAVAEDETNVQSVPRLKCRDSKKQAEMEAAVLKNQGHLTIGEGKAAISVLAAPCVRNGPPDQDAFHRKLLDLQIVGPLPFSTIARRLSLVENVGQYGPTSQHQLESPKSSGVSWSSNYGTHGWHRYVGRFPPHVVRSLLNHFGADAQSIVCDPFAGSGTTAVECRLLGIPFVGIEICPLSAMMTRTKAAFPVQPNDIVALSQEFLTFYDDRLNEFLANRTLSTIRHDEVLGRKGNPIPTFANVDRWFTPEALLGTSITVEFGLTFEGFMREALLLALSSKMRSIGNVDVDVVRAEYSKRPRENVDVKKLVARQLNKMVKDISASVASHSGLIGPQSSIVVHEGSILDIELEPSSIDHVITSPPYGVEAISYLRTHLLSYRALVAHLGHDPYETRSKTIGSEYLTATHLEAGKRSEERSNAYRRFFGSTPQYEEPKYYARRAAMMQFCDDMLAVGERIARWLKYDGQAAFIIGNKRLGDGVIPMDAIVTELFSSCGLTLTDVIRHKLKTNNSNSQVPWQERVIQEESILLFKRGV